DLPMQRPRVGDPLRADAAHERQQILRPPAVYPVWTVSDFSRLLRTLLRRPGTRVSGDLPVMIDASGEAVATLVSVLVSFVCVRARQAKPGYAGDQDVRTTRNGAGRCPVALKSGRSAVRPRPCPPVLRRADKTVTSVYRGRRFALRRCIAGPG